MCIAHFYTMMVTRLFLISRYGQVSFFIRITNYYYKRALKTRTFGQNQSLSAFKTAVYSPGLVTKKFVRERGEGKMAAERYLCTLSTSSFSSTKCTAQFRSSLRLYSTLSYT